MPILVKDVMSKKVNTIEENKSVFQASKIMAKSRRGYVIVLKKNKPVGILTDSDILEKVISKGKDVKKIKVKEVMSSPLITISPDVDISEVSRIMRKNLIKRIPVVDKGKLIGVITDSDIAKVTPEFVNILEERLEAKARGFEPERIESSTSGICEECGNYSDRLFYINGKWLCESCKEQEEKD